MATTDRRASKPLARSSSSPPARPSSAPSISRTRPSARASLSAARHSSRLRSPTRWRMIPDRALQPKVFAMSAFFRCLALAVLLAGGLAAPTRAAEPLTPEQKQAVEGIIHDYLLSHPEFLIEVAHAAQEKIKQDKAADARQAIATFRNELTADATSPVGGNPDGDVTIVEFFDYRCPYCKQVEPTLEALLKEDPKIRIIYKEFPVLGAESIFASRVALAA